MANGTLLRIMLLKEIRTTFRERAQMRALVISMVVMLLAVSSAFFQSTGRARDITPVSQPAGTQAAPAMAPVDVDAIAGESPIARWIAIATAGGLGFMFTLGYLIAAVLACFVGEKESRTLEVLLASPISDAKLFAVKVVSVLIPSAAIGSFFIVVVSLLLAFVAKSSSLHLPVSLLPYALLGIPLMLLPQLFFLGLGVAISARAETMKGAGQALGGAFVILIFGSIYGVPLLFRAAPALRSALGNAVVAWLTWPFVPQFALVLGLLCVPALITLAIGRASFRRERMLM